MLMCVLWQALVIEYGVSFNRVIQDFFLLFILFIYSWRSASQRLALEGSKAGIFWRVSYETRTS